MCIRDRIEAEYPGVETDWHNFTSERYTEPFAAAEATGDQIDMFHANGQDFRRYTVAVSYTHLDVYKRQLAE